MNKSVQDTPSISRFNLSMTKEGFDVLQTCFLSWNMLFLSPILSFTTYFGPNRLLK